MTDNRMKGYSPNKPDGGALKGMMFGPTDAGINPGTIKQLRDILGLSVEAIDADGKNYLKINVPQNMNREAYVDNFVALKNRIGLGLHRGEFEPLLGVHDNLHPGYIRTHDPDAFYLLGTDATDQVLQTMKDHRGEFQAIKSAAQTPQSGSKSPAPKP